MATENKLICDMGQDSVIIDTDFSFPPGAAGATFTSDTQYPGWRIAVAFGTEDYDGSTRRGTVYVETVGFTEHPSGAFAYFYDHGASAKKKPKEVTKSQAMQVGRTELYDSVFYYSTRLRCAVIVRFPSELLRPRPIRVASQTDIAKIYSTLDSFITKCSAQDVRFTLFSRRREIPGGADTPRHIYVNTALLAETRMSEVFNTLIHGHEFAPYDEVGHSVEAETYDYDSDSDLDEILEENRSVASRDASKPAVPANPRQATVDADLSSSVALPAQGEALYESTPTLLGQLQRSVVIKDGAYNTWRSLIFYLYTGHIAFAPLVSAGARQRCDSIEKFAQDNTGRPIPCSPKSMFRLAEKYDFQKLQDAALNAIIAGITTTNAVDEYFSTITVRYKRVREAQIPFLRAHLQDQEVKAALRKQMGLIKDRPTLSEYWVENCMELFLP